MVEGSTRIALRDGQVEHLLAQAAVVLQIRPTAREFHEDPAGTLGDARRDFDQPRLPRARVPFAERVALKPVVVMPSALSSGEGLGGNFLARVFWRRIGHDMPQTDQPVIRRGVQIETKQVGHVAMIAQPVRL